MVSRACTEPCGTHKYDNSSPAVSLTLCVPCAANRFLGSLMHDGHLPRGAPVPGGPVPASQLGGTTIREGTMSATDASIPKARAQRLVLPADSGVKVRRAPTAQYISMAMYFSRPRLNELGRGGGSSINEAAKVSPWPPRQLTRGWKCTLRPERLRKQQRSTPQ